MVDRPSRDGRDSSGYWLWALASSTQLVAGVVSYRRGCSGDSRLMPFKAFVVASLFVGAGATSAAGLLNFFGIQKVEHLKELGANIRNGLGVPPRDTTR
ncbi:hypothetical protein Scep_024952 [Stephania cephalantha]|uniref:Uncharacterized protein n=1 Tax=Stephania cephalantha TaxID=152367 RepID=A0AAP0F311_9MAGN